MNALLTFAALAMFVIAAAVSVPTLFGVGFTALGIAALRELSVF